MISKMEKVVSLNLHNDIHPTAIVSSKSKIANNVTIGPYSFIGDNVSIGSNCQIGAHVIIDGHTSIGENNSIFAGCQIGNQPQDLKYEGESSTLIIGNNNTIREHVTISIGTTLGGGFTKLGDDNLLMIGSHIAHDVCIGNHNVIANQVQIAGHVQIDNWATIGGLTGVHQFIKIGTMAMIGGNTKLIKHVLPFSLVDGNPAKCISINYERLKRRDFANEEIRILKECFKIISNVNNSMKQVINEFNNTYNNQPLVNQIIEFIGSPELNKRGCYR